jgi:hypothetical protein
LFEQLAKGFAQVLNNQNTYQNDGKADLSSFLGGAGGNN